ncbi:MAG: energy-coupling factor ABC transporter ATP-binding protein [Cyanophyceae cyanobacterium]
MSHFLSSESVPLTAAIELDHLTYGWPGAAPVLRDCCLRIPRGQLWMLLGPNGSGKSTLMQLMAGVAKLESLEAQSYLQRQLRVQAPIGMVFQNPDHQLVMPTVGADVAFGLAAEPLSLLEIRWRVEKALSQVGLLPLLRRPIHSLSGGQKQRVAVAGALARHCQVLLLDEPTALLDPESQQELIDQVRDLVDQEGLTVLWVTHRLEELGWADGAVILDQGQIKAQGSPTQIRRELGRLFGLKMG